MPTSPVAPYRGGKRNLAKRITALIDATSHRTYAEPFVGLGGIFLRRRSSPQLEVVNDLNHDVANFYRVMQRHYAAFVDLLRYQLSSRADFERLEALGVRGLTDLERAARFFYLQSTAYGGKVRDRSFGASLHRPGRFNLLRIAPLLQDFHDRLSGVVIENLPFERFMSLYDSDETLFHLDPPYWGGEQDYGRELFHRSDFERLRDILLRARGRFFLSINETPDTRLLFRDFKAVSVLTRYGLQGGSMPAREMIVSNI